jgi:hypothetical protein
MKCLKFLNLINEVSQFCEHFRMNLALKYGSKDYSRKVSDKNFKKGPTVEKFKFSCIISMDLRVFFLNLKFSAKSKNFLQSIC